MASAGSAMRLSHVMADFLQLHVCPAKPLTSHLFAEHP